MKLKASESHISKVKKQIEFENENIKTHTIISLAVFFLTISIMSVLFNSMYICFALGSMFSTLYMHHAITSLKNDRVNRIGNIYKEQGVLFYINHELFDGIKDLDASINNWYDLPSDKRASHEKVIAASYVFAMILRFVTYFAIPSLLFFIVGLF